VEISAVEGLRQAVGRAGSILVVSHVAPDGDAIGSLTAMGLMLEQLGKRATLACDDGVPDRYAFLPLAATVRQRIDPRAYYDLLIALDCGDLGRLGQAYADLAAETGPACPAIVNIDHHVTNTRFGEVNLVVTGAASTTEILCQLVPALGLRLTPPLATCLLTGLVTDTLSFRTAGVNGDTLKAAGSLVDAGANLYEVTSRALNLKPFSTLLFYQKGLNNMRFEDGLLWTTVSGDERSDAGYSDASSSGLVNLMAEVHEAAMSAVFLEMDDGSITVGFRCRPPFSVSELALGLGGGGHILASGCTLPGPLSQAESLVVSLAKAAIRQQNRSHANGERR
jgi:phosphoesterase RecJ-like protein